MHAHRIIVTLSHKVQPSLVKSVTTGAAAASAAYTSPDTLRRFVARPRKATAPRCAAVPPHEEDPKPRRRQCPLGPLRLVATFGRELSKNAVTRVRPRHIMAFILGGGRTSSRVMDLIWRKLKKRCSVSRPREEYERFDWSRAGKCGPFSRGRI